MDSALSPVYKRQIALLAVIIGAGLVLTYFFGLVIGLALNTAMLVALALYIRKERTGAVKSFGFGTNNMPGGGYTSDSVKLRFVCIPCGAQVNGVKCGKCGSKMKKPVFY